MGKDCLDYVLCGSYTGTAALHSPFHSTGLYMPDIYSPSVGATGGKGKHCVQHSATLACHAPHFRPAGFFLFAPLAALPTTPHSPLGPWLDPPGAFLSGGVPGMTWKARAACTVACWANLLASSLAPGGWGEPSILVHSSRQVA